ncbi:phosphodiester glycosidase family protein [Marinagarivorans cellulosilyticus]|uniref:Phosphodiester glycosidase domain-containing protein n=1 Tax=Marinagarivorans cellulosilyticus TaxID=2721545 RepID=A0AAN1WEP9_9GAMM|nr:phosphodiester glycosidase family protein [Marinagarivorans cellulosilyticus]BCD96233.1 hypothetical protein MARGE09_P0432 [Marinagarivorans cellulosilyticus]
MSTPEKIEMKGAGFWAAAIKRMPAKKYLFAKDGTLNYVVFDDSVQMEPFVRTQEVMFETTAAAASKANRYLATINAQVYDITTAGMMDYAIGDDAVAPSNIVPEGIAVFGKKVIAGRAAPLNFYIANTKAPLSGSRPYRFGFGAAPTSVDSAIGGAGPIIINGLPYGTQNRYKAGAKLGKKVGQPIPANAKNLTQRSNATFTAFTKHDAAPRTGITAIAHNAKEKKLIIIVHPDNSGDLSLRTLRTKLLSIGCDNAIFLDGSNSSMLMVEGTFIARQALSKNKTNIVGIGFKY